MSKNDRYVCGECGEEDYGKAPYCKCEREYDKQEKEIKAQYHRERSKRDDHIGKVTNPNYYPEMESKFSKDTLKYGSGALNSMET